MRRLARDALDNRGLASMADDAMLVVSELVTNAIVHSGGTEITLSLDINEDVLRIAVRDGMPGHPAALTPDHDEESGRGLQLVRWIAGERGGAWGTSGCGTTTWCDLPVAEAGR
jgi:anti-sigma regulatory factor (Ser/Thr protein kinase)